MKVGVIERTTAEIHPDRQFQLAGRMVDPQIRQVTWNSETISLEPKSIDLLFVLIAAAGRPVSRAELIEKVWCGAVVSDDAVQRTVWKLRRALGDDTKAPEIIGTLPKSGYRLLVLPRQKQDLNIPNWGVGAAAMFFVVVVGWLATQNRALSTAAEFDFTAARAITSSPGFELAPALAPDGNLLAYVAYDEEQENPSLDLLMLDRNSGETHILADGPGMQAWPVWSPDSRSLLYINHVQGNCEITLLTIANRSERVAAPCIDPDGVQLAWNGNDQSVYVLDGTASEGGKQLYVLDLVNSASEPVPIDVGDVQDMALSPSGGKLALVRERHLDRQDVYVFDISSGAQRRITAESRDIEGVSWSSDERSLIISSDRAGLFRLWELRISDGVMSAIAAPGMNAAFPEIGSDFGPLIYQVWDNEINLQLVGGNHDDGERIARSNGWEWSPAPSPNGKSLAFLTNRNGSAGLWLSDIDGSNPHRVAAFEASFDSILSWSPDSERIALSALVGDRFSLAIVNSSTGELTWIRQPNANLRDPVFSPDGKTLYYASDFEGEWNIRKQSLDEEGGEQIVAAGVLARFSHDAATLYIATEDGALDRLDLLGGERRNIISNRRAAYARAWTPTREGIAYLDGSFTDGYRLMDWNELTNDVSLRANLEGDILVSSALAQNIDGGIWIARIEYCGSDLWEAPLIH